MAVSATVKFYAYISGAWTQLLDVQPFSVSWGLGNNDALSLMADVGELRLRLNNQSGIYSTSGPSGLTGWKKGIPVKMEITYGSNIKRRFYGKIDDIRLPSVRYGTYVDITVVDWFDYALKQPLVNPRRLTSTTIDAGVNELLGNVPVAPLASSVTPAEWVYPSLLDTVRDRTKAYEELSKFANSEIAPIYLRHDGAYGETLVTEAYATRNGTNTLTQKTIPTSPGDALLLDGGTYDGDNFLLDGGTYDGNNFLLDTAETITASLSNSDIIYKNVEYGKLIKNRFVGNAFPKRVDTNPVLIYASEKPVRLSPAETKTYRVFFTDPNGKRRINAIPPTGAGGVVALMPFNRDEVRGTSGTGGQNGQWLDLTGKIADHYDVPYIDFSKTGDGSAYFDGSLAWIEYPYSPDWNFGGGDFWIEYYLWRNAKTSGQTVMSRDGTDASPSFLVGYTNGTNEYVYLSSDGSTWDIANAVSMGVATTGAWNHYAVGRCNGILYTFKDGTLISSSSASGTVFSVASNLYLGKNTTNYLSGNIENLIIIKGECLYTASFTVPSGIPGMREGAYYEMNTAEDYTGTDIKGSLTASATYGTEGATVTIENTGSVTGWVKVKIYGYGIYSDSQLETAIEDEMSINENGHHVSTLNQVYQDATSLALLEGRKIIELNKGQRTVLNRVRFAANKSDTLMKYLLYWDIGNLVNIAVTEDGIDNYYYIQGVDISSKGNLHYADWSVKQAWTLTKGYQYIACEFAGNADDRIDFEYIPIVSADSVNHRCFSAWVYLDAVTASYDQTICGAYSGDTGSRFYVDADATNVILSFDSARFATAGKWSTGTNPFTVAGWHHVLVEYNSADATNDPVFYVDGSLASSSEGTTPSGAAVSEQGNSFVIGNTKAGTDCWNGKLKDVRVYDMEKTSTSASSLASALNTEGAGGSGNYDGMVFNAFVVRSEDEASYQDLSLTTESLLDGYMGYVGTPSGSPITRLIV